LYFRTFKALKILEHEDDAKYTDVVDKKYDDIRQYPETDQDQMDQNHMQNILNGICNDLVDFDPFLKIA
jgi:hypothetical protein